MILAVFGQTPAGIRTGLILTTSATTVATYLLGARLGGSALGVAAAAVFAALSLNPKMLGIAAYAEHFALLPVVAGALVLWRGGRERRPISLLTCGILFGLGLLIRQSAALFVIGAVAYLLVARGDGIAEHPRVGRLGAIAVFSQAPPRRWRSPAWRSGPPGLSKPFGSGCSRTRATTRPTRRRAGATSSARSARWRRPRRWCCALAAVGLGAAIRDPNRDRRTFVVAFTASAVLGTMMGLQFRLHYFLLAVPALAMLSGIGLVALGGLLATQPPRALRWALPCTLGLVALAQPLYASRAVLFELGPGQISRAIYGRNPFPESVEVARYIREHSAAGDRVAVVGSEPQIYFYSARRSATGYIYTYPLMELQPYAPAMQREMIKEIEAAAPRFLVFVSATSSWIVRPGSDRDDLRLVRGLSARLHTGRCRRHPSTAGRPCIDGVTRRPATHHGPMSG